MNTIANDSNLKTNTALAEPGNTGEINNVCVEYTVADQRLRHWANWLHEQSVLKQLGYPGCSPEQKLPGTTHGPIETYSPEAEEVEKLLTEIKQKWYEVYQALLAYYFMGMSIRAAAEHNDISPITFQKYYSIGMGWMEARLSNK